MKFTKETLYRALRTFLQVAGGYIAANLPLICFTDDFDIVKSALLGLGVTAISTGLAAVMNLEGTNDK